MMELEQTFKCYSAIPGLSSKGGEISYIFYFIVFLVADKLFRAESDPSGKSSEGQFSIEKYVAGSSPQQWTKPHSLQR